MLVGIKFFTVIVIEFIVFMILMVRDNEKKNIVKKFEKRAKKPLVRKAVHPLTVATIVLVILSLVFNNLLLMLASGAFLYLVIMLRVFGGEK